MLIKINLVRISDDFAKKISFLETYVNVDYIVNINECDMRLIESVSGLQEYIVEEGLAPSDFIMIELINDRAYFALEKVRKILKKMNH